MQHEGMPAVFYCIFGTSDTQILRSNFDIDESMVIKATQCVCSGIFTSSSLAVKCQLTLNYAIKFQEDSTAPNLCRWTVFLFKQLYTAVQLDTINAVHSLCLEQLYFHMFIL